MENEIYVKQLLVAVSHELKLNTYMTHAVLEKLFEKGLVTREEISRIRTGCKRIDIHFLSVFG